MNEQKAPNGIEWTRVAFEDGVRLRGYTWNPIGGCRHACRWTMPDGSTAICYAEDVATRLVSASYPQGFEAHYWKPQLLDEPAKLKTPAGIFVGSMADVFGAWVPDDHIRLVLDACQRAPQHYFMMLTKNAPRLLHYQFPRNVLVGVSSPPDFMHGKALSRDQQTRMLRRTMETLRQLKSANQAAVVWISIEPLSWDISEVLAEFPRVLDWAVIGAASSGSKWYAIDEDVFMRVQNALDKQRVPTFYKGNLRSTKLAAALWREEFPFNRRMPPPEKPTYNPAEWQEYYTRELWEIDQAHSAIARHYQCFDRGSIGWHTRHDELCRNRDQLIAAYQAAQSKLIKPKRGKDVDLREQIAKIEHSISVLLPHKNTSAVASDMLAGKQTALEKLRRALANLESNGKGRAAA